MTTRRAFAALALLSAAGLALNAHANSAYPNKPVRVIVPYSPGGTTDTAARLVAAKLSETLGQTFFVDNRPGATGTIGTQAVARAPADGYTLLANDTTYSILPNLFAKLPWDHASDLTPVTTLVTTPVVLLVPAASPYKTLQDLIQAAQKSPGKLNFGSGGPGSSTHFAAELFTHQANIRMTHIPYKGGGDAMGALMANQVEMLVDAPPTAMPFIQSGKARALAISSTARIAALPNVPTFQESGLKDYTVVNWFGTAVPKGTPDAVVSRLHAEITKVLAMPDVKVRLEQLGVEPGGMPPAAFATFIRSETQRWSELAQRIGVKPEQ